MIWGHAAHADEPDAGVDAGVDAAVRADAVRPIATPDASVESVSAEDLRDVMSSDALPKSSHAGSGDSAPTGTLRIGVYHDSDQTTVIRSLATVAKNWGPWSFAGTLVADVISSASVDVRSSVPQVLAPDTVTTASGRSTISNGSMEDQRYPANFKGGWRDPSGQAANASVAIATENDYFSLGGGLDGAYPVSDQVSLIGGVTITDNWISNALDTTFGAKLFAAGYTAGATFILSHFDVVRARYDGETSSGYESSPYRDVRFGDWTANFRQGEITFTTPTGADADFRAEHEPSTRTRHAAVLEWFHTFVPGVAIHPAIKVGHDSWDVNSMTASLDLRHVSQWWRTEFGYRLYLQSAANFFEDKYTASPAAYSYWTSDQNLGQVRGQAAHIDIQRVLLDADSPTDSRMMFHIEVEAMHDSYPGFILLSTLNSLFVSLGFSYEM